MEPKLKVKRVKYSRKDRFLDMFSSLALRGMIALAVAAFVILNVVTVIAAPSAIPENGDVNANFTSVETGPLKAWSLDVSGDIWDSTGTIVSINDSLRIMGGKQLQMTGAGVITNFNDGRPLRLTESYGIQLDGKISDPNSSLRINDTLELSGSNSLHLTGTGSISNKDSGEPVRIVEDDGIELNGPIFDGGSAVEFNDNVKLLNSKDLSLTGDGYIYNSDTGKKVRIIESNGISLDGPVTLPGEDELDVRGTIVNNQDPGFLGLEGMVMIDDYVGILGGLIMQEDSHATTILNGNISTSGTISSAGEIGSIYGLWKTNGTSGSSTYETLSLSCYDGTYLIGCSGRVKTSSQTEPQALSGTWFPAMHLGTRMSGGETCTSYMEMAESNNSNVAIADNSHIVNLKCFDPSGVQQ